MKPAQSLFTFLMGFFIYSLFEIATRGYTHWTMALTGGLVLSLLYHLNRRLTLSPLRSSILGALMITAIEFPVGLFDNILMGWHVWDYSDVPLNIMGQVCPLYSGIWFLLCLPAYYLCRRIRGAFTSPAFSGR